MKDLRLAALRDPMAPLAFLESYEEASAKTDLFWQRRVLDAVKGKTSRQFVAEAPDAALSGTVTVLVEEPGTADHYGTVVKERQGHVVGVFVRPERRGQGLIQALLDAALEWAWSLEGLDRIRLFVDERNTHAERVYLRAGFVHSGHSAAAPGGADARDLEMVLYRPGSPGSPGSAGPA
ncbi:N-acetyltransferase [Streptomyces sulfonofaciens]|uniref:N-acetyltransferase n=1 Tax=Streptomyces sulfonofaciens TaxID=68272 RepID=A0A919L8H8_9ACTN|nr:N-acetyltransferase [Streptomyces sulfonofaciens]